MHKTTPLNALHRASGARMVDFGGFDMPLHYGSQVDEHHAVRRDAGMFDVSHMRVVDIGGDAARAFLRRALANDVAKLTIPGKALYSCLLREDGGVLDDLIAYFLRDDFFRLVVNAATADKDIAWLTALAAKEFPGLRITPRADLAIVAVQGPNARAKVWRAVPETESAAALKPFQAIGVATAMQAHLRTRMDSIAIMKSIGGRSGQVVTIYALQTILLGLTGGICGVGVGYAIQGVFPALIERFLQIRPDKVLTCCTKMLMSIRVPPALLVQAR